MGVIFPMQQIMNLDSKITLCHPLIWNRSWWTHFLFVKDAKNKRKVLEPSWGIEHWALCVVFPIFVGNPKSFSTEFYRKSGQLVQLFSALYWFVDKFAYMLCILMSRYMWPVWGWESRSVPTYLSHNRVWEGSILRL